MTKLLLLVTLVFAATASSGSAAGPGGPHLLGIVPHRSAAAPHALSKSNALRAASPAPSFLTFDAPYVSLINQYFTDVADDSGGTTNVYSVTKQYAPIEYQSTVGGSYVDHDPLPANGCDDGLDPYCLTDQQLQGEIQNALTAEGWHGSTSAMFFLMTPSGVGSCADSSGVMCSTNYFCAYHSDFVDANGEDVIYANEPYEGPIGGCNGTAVPNPGPGFGFPNDEDSDTTINTISHEHIEAITDPFGSAWYADDGSGDEIGDLCAYYYGPKVGTAPNGQPYSQKINGHDYSLQQEYSNADNGCVPYLGGPHTHETFGSGPLVNHLGPVMQTNTTYAIYWLPRAGNTAAPGISGDAAVNHTLTATTGSWNGAPTGYAFQWQRCTSTGASCANISGATGSSYTLTTSDGGASVRVTVSATNVNGASPYAASSADAVVPVPVANTPPVVSGAAGVGKRLTTTGGSWNTSVTLAYQWQRCAAGGSCAPIAGATGATYALAGPDAGHVLKAVVTAANVAGTASATSAASHKVVAVPKSTSKPRISGKATVGHLLKAGHGKWTWTPSRYGYQWLRCSASGGRCGAIKKATGATYRVGKNDAGHRLRLRVTATNAAGSKTAMSRATSGVSAPH